VPKYVGVGTYHELFYGLYSIRCICW